MSQYSFQVHNEISKDEGLFSKLRANEVTFIKAQFNEFDANLVNATNIIAEDITVTSDLDVAGTITFDSLNVNGTTTTQDLIVVTDTTLADTTINGSLDATGNCTFGTNTLSSHTVNGVMHVSKSIEGEGVIETQRSKFQNPIGLFVRSQDTNVTMDNLGKDNAIYHLIPPTAVNVNLTSDTGPNIISNLGLDIDDTFTLLVAAGGNATSVTVHANAGVDIFGGNPNYLINGGDTMKFVGVVTTSATIELFPTGH